jgi:hypothetical protein
VSKARIAVPQGRHRAASTAQNAQFGAALTAWPLTGSAVQNGGSMRMRRTDPITDRDPIPGSAQPVFENVLR